VTIKRLFKVKPMTPSYSPLKTIQLLFKTFSLKPPWFRVTLMSQVKWNTLYIQGVRKFNRQIFRDCRGLHKNHFLQMNLGSETCHYIATAYGVFERVGTSKSFSKKGMLCRYSKVSKCIVAFFPRCRLVLLLRSIRIVSSCHLCCCCL